MIRKVLRFVIVVILVVACAVATVFVLDHINGDRMEPAIYEARTDLDNTEPSETEIAEYNVAPDLPRYMSIARIGVSNARVVGLGTTGDDNRLADPSNIFDVGWYYGSAKPGQASSDVVPASLYDGHNTGAYARGVFYRLGELASGDEIIIERGDGTLFTYTVRESSTVLVPEVDMSIMMQSVEPGVEGLNIISCGGDWDEATSSYTHRVLIRAVLMSKSE